MPRPHPLSVMLALPALALAPTGCQRTMVEQTLNTNYAPDDVAADLEFTHSLPLHSAVANDESLHAVIVFALNQDTCGSYERRLELAKGEGWLPADFAEPPNMAMQRGTLARALVQIMHIRGGLIMRLTGPIPRYATRELVDAGVFSQGSTENQTLTGLELIAALSRARDYIDQREADAARRAAPPATPAPAQPAADGPSEPVAPAPAESSSAPAKAAGPSGGARARD